MKLEDVGIARDEREGRSVHTSATTGPNRTLEEATTAALTSLVRTADETDLVVDAATLTTQVKTMRVQGSAPRVILMVVAYAIAYPA